MEILDENCALLSNWEVSSHLKHQKDQRIHHDRTTKFTSRTQENLRTIEFEISQYLHDPLLGETAHIGAKQILAFLAHFKQVPLTKAEKLQIINLQPNSLLELHLIIEECEERFDEAQLNEMLMAVSVLFRPQPKAAAEAKKGEVEDIDSLLADNFVPDMNDI